MRVYLEITEKKLGKVLRKYRYAHGLTQQKVADHLGIDRTTYSKYETTRKPELNIIMKLVTFYDVSLDDFLSDFFAEMPDDVNPVSVASSPSGESAEELFTLNSSEKQLLLFYRDSLRKKEILENAREVWLQDTAASDEAEG